MTAARALKMVAPVALLLLALGATIAFLAMPVHRYDWMRDFGEGALPDDPDATMRMALAATPALVAWFALALVSRVTGHHRMMGVALVAAVFVVAVAIFRLS